MALNDLTALLAKFAIGKLLPEPLPTEPFTIAKEWFDRAHREKVQPNPNAMTLATVDADGKPSARIVLCKTFEAQRGYLVFFTNYESRKGAALVAHPRAAAVMHWDALDLQVRFEGPVVRAPAAESDAYFATRGWQNRLGAWSSAQSQPIESRAAMVERVGAAMEKLGLSATDLLFKGNGVSIPRPPHWGGFRLWPERVELWQGGTGRVHDRAAWTRSVTPLGGSEGECTTGGWSATRLQP